MRMPKGKHVYINKEHPEALGICDRTGFVHMHKDLVQEMEWRGDRLVWTGFLVGKEYLDTPNQSLRPPILPPDPVPVVRPRPPQGWEAVTPDPAPVPYNQAYAALENFNWGWNSQMLANINQEEN